MAALMVSLGFHACQWSVWVGVPALQGANCEKTRAFMLACYNKRWRPPLIARFSTYHILCILLRYAAQFKFIKAPRDCRHFDDSLNLVLTFITAGTFKATG